MAFWGFVVSFAFMVGASCVAGMRLDIALALWVSHLVLAIGLSRIGMEGGMLGLMHNTTPLAAIAKLLHTGPSRWLTPENGLVPSAFFQAGLIDGVKMRAFVMPSFVHSFKLAYDCKIAPRPLAALLSATILISVVISWWTCVRLGYEHGGLTLGHQWWTQEGARQPAYFIDSMTNADSGSAPGRWLWLGFGGALTYGMMLARSRFTFFPFHPIGYMVALTYPAHTFWFSIFLGWLCKTLITRFGGSDSYRKATPAFLGLVLGDVSMILFWLAIDGWQGRTSHLLLPG